MSPFFVSLPFSTLAVAEQVTEVQEGHETLQRGLILLAVEDHVFTELTSEKTCILIGSFSSSW